MSITLEHINYTYSEGTAYEKKALKDIKFGDSPRAVCRDHRTYRFREVYTDPAFQWIDQGHERGVEV